MHDKQKEKKGVEGCSLLQFIIGDEIFQEFQR